MPLLPQPDTTSPGALNLMYVVGTVEHNTSANFLATADITDVDNVRLEAIAFAEELQDLLTNISSVHGWRITDPAGVSLYEEEFAVAYDGIRAPNANERFAQSASGSLTGKGVPAVGLAQGQTRTTVFLGSFDFTTWTEARHPLTVANINWTNLRQFLGVSDLIGADHYGVKATYRNYWTPQLNAHYQKRFGF